MPRIRGIGMPATTPPLWRSHQDWWDAEDPEDPAAATTESWDPETTTTEATTPFFWGVFGGQEGSSEAAEGEPDWWFWGVAGGLVVCLLSLLAILIWRIR